MRSRVLALPLHNNRGAKSGESLRGKNVAWLVINKYSEKNELVAMENMYDLLLKTATGFLR